MLDTASEDLLTGATTALGLVASEAALVRSRLASLHAPVLERAGLLVLGARGEFALGTASSGHGRLLVRKKCPILL
jgi:hypothetical protein